MKIQRGEFNELGVVTIHEHTVLTDSETGETVEGKPHTRTVIPGDDISELSGIAREICEKVHTPERKAKIQQMRESSRGNV